MGLFSTVPGCTWLYLTVPDCTWLYLALLWSAMIYLSTDSHILLLAGLNAFVYTGLNAQKLWVGMGWGWDRLLVLVDGMEIGNIFVCLIPCYHKHESGKPKWICWFSCTKNDVSLTTLLSFSSPWASLLPLARQTLQCRLTLLRAEAWKEGVLKKK